MEKVTRLPLDQDRGAERRRLHLREITDGSEAPEATVGEELRAARLRLGEDLRTVAGSLRIRKEHLEALEAGDFANLPGRTYAIGFVRSYADYLGLDGAAAVARFKEEVADEPELPPAESLVFPDAQEEARLPQGMILIAAVLVLLALWGAYYLARFADKMLHDRAPAAAVSETVPAPEAPAAVAPAAEPEAAAADAAADEATTAEASVPVPTEGMSTFGSNDPAVRIEVRALKNDVWLRVEDPDKNEVLITKELKAGERFRAPPDRPNLVLVTRDAGALELILDGISTGTAGSNGEVIEGMPLTPDALSARLNRH